MKIYEQSQTTLVFAADNEVSITEVTPAQVISEKANFKITSKRGADNRTNYTITAAFNLQDDVSSNTFLTSLITSPNNYFLQIDLLAISASYFIYKPISEVKVISNIMGIKRIEIIVNYFRKEFFKVV